MIVGIHSISLFSHDAPRLARFYRDVLHLPTSHEGECPRGDDNEKAFDFVLPDGRPLFVVDHSEVNGPNRNPERIIINFAVEDLETSVTALRAAGVRQIGDCYEVPALGRIATFADPDDNFIQLLQPA